MDVPRHESPSGIGIGNGTSYVGVGLEAEYWFLSCSAMGTFAWDPEVILPSSWDFATLAT